MTQRLLLDSHVLLWWFGQPNPLSHNAKAAIADRRNKVFVSVATVWEIAIKVRVGKLRIPEGMLDVLEEENLIALPITGEHARRAAELPMIHRDPFDRMLVAQALVEELRIVTADLQILRYNVPTLSLRG
jgi:PIN domain nuclease of toxin-antitoxin system